MCSSDLAKGITRRSRVNTGMARSRAKRRYAKTGGPRGRAARTPGALGARPFPYAGIIQVRFEGFDSQALASHPQRSLRYSFVLPNISPRPPAARSRLSPPTPPPRRPATPAGRREHRARTGSGPGASASSCSEIRHHDGDRGVVLLEWLRETRQIGRAHV